MTTTLGEGWTQFLLRPQAIQSLYTTPPAFVVLHEVVLHRDGPRADLRLELDRFPDAPPKRWDPGVNRVQVVLRFDELEGICIDRWGWNGTLSQGCVEKHGAEIAFRFVGPDVSVSGSSRTVDVQRFGAYMVDP